jgi:integrase
MPSEARRISRRLRQGGWRPQGPLFRSSIGKTTQLTDRPMLRGDVWSMVRRRASGAGIETAIGCHAFRATGIMDYLTNGGRIEVAQRMAGHSNAKTTGLLPNNSTHGRTHEVCTKASRDAGGRGTNSVAGLDSAKDAKHI